MNKTEQAARPNKEDNKYQMFDLTEKKNGVTSIPFDHVSYESDLEDYIDNLEANSQPLNLDVKRDEYFNVLVEPDVKEVKLNMSKKLLSIYTKEYQQAKTVREKIAELEEKTKSQANELISQDDKIEQLTKERDELKEICEGDKLTREWLDKYDNILKLEKQLQAEKSKTKELEEGLRELIKDAPYLYHEDVEQLLNKQ